MPKTEKQWEEHINTLWDKSSAHSEMDWISLEMDMRSVLMLVGSDLTNKQGIKIIDQLLGVYTGRGGALVGD